MHHIHKCIALPLVLFNRGTWKPYNAAAAAVCLPLNGDDSHTHTDTLIQRYSDTHQRRMPRLASVVACVQCSARRRIPDWMTMNIYMFTFSTSTFFGFIVTSVDTMCFVRCRHRVQPHSEPEHLSHVYSIYAHLCDGLQRERLPEGCFVIFV